MPKLNPKQPTVDLTSLGLMVALADLADAKGLTVRDVIDSDRNHLAEAGLPERSKVPHGVALDAHRLQRDRIDALLWRCNGTMEVVILPAAQPSTKPRPTVMVLKEDGRPAEGRPKPPPKPPAPPPKAARSNEPPPPLKAAVVPKSRSIL